MSDEMRRCVLSKGPSLLLLLFALLILTVSGTVTATAQSVPVDRGHYLYPSAPLDASMR